MPFLPPNQQRQSTEGILYYYYRNLTMKQIIKWLQCCIWFVQLFVVLVMMLICREPWLDSRIGDCPVSTDSSHMSGCLSSMASSSSKAKVTHACMHVCAYPLIFMAQSYASSVYAVAQCLCLFMDIWHYITNIACLHVPLSAELFANCCFSFLIYEDQCCKELI